MFIFGVKVHLVNIYVKQLIEQGLTSHQTHYRSYRRRFLQVI